MKDLINKILVSHAGWEAVMLRVPIGIILAAHGSQKLFGWFGGYGLEGTGQFMASIGLNPGFLMALLAGSSEFFGGIALILGLMTRPCGCRKCCYHAGGVVWGALGQGLFSRFARH